MSPSLSREEAWAALTDAHTGILTTLKADGTPVTLPMWFVVLDGRIYVSTPERSKKVARVRRNPRVAFLVESGERWVDLQAVHLTGHARVVDNDELDARVRKALADKYAAYRSEENNRRVEGIAMAVIEIAPDNRMLRWDNSRLTS